MRDAALGLILDCLSVGPVDAAGLAGRLADPATDWTEVIGVANNALLTPSVFAGLDRKGLLGRLPEDVRAYLAELHRLNRERNRRLAAQALEAVEALNAAGIEPMLLKGAARLLARGGAPVDRILVDIDLQVPAASVAAARRALAGIGYEEADEIREDVHTIANFKRSRDVGMIDLHRDTFDFPGLLPAAVLRQRGEAAADAKGRRYVLPAADDQVLYRLLHDQVQDFQHYQGRIDLARLGDFVDLVLAAGSLVDWPAMERRLATLGLGAAMGSHLLAAHELLGLPLPAGVTIAAAARKSHRRRLFLMARPRLLRSMRLVGHTAFFFARCRYAPLPEGVKGELRLLERRLFAGLPQSAAYIAGIVRKRIATTP